MLPALVPLAARDFTGLTNPRPATEAEWLEQERQDVTKRRIWTLDRRLRAALDEPRVLDLRVALINAAAADWLRESGWTVTAPGVPD